MAAPGDDDEGWFTDELIEKYRNGEMKTMENEWRLDTAEHIIEDMNKSPLFAATMPEDGQESDAFHAIQALKDELSENPDEDALYWKDKGNVYFKKGGLDEQGKKFYKLAIEMYCNGMKEKNISDSIKCVLLLNRAAVEIKLKNYRTTVKLCAEARALGSDNVKLFFRAASACEAVERIDEAISWCDSGLDLDAENEQLNVQRKRLAKTQVLKQRNERMKQQREQREKREKEKLQQAIEHRGVTMVAQEGRSQFVDDELVDLMVNPTGSNVGFDEDGDLVWPVMFLYPEYQQSDFVAAFSECHTFEQQLEMVLAEQVPWDKRGDYRLGNVTVYYETPVGCLNDRTQLVKVDLKQVLGQTMMDPRHRVVGGMAVFFLVVTDSSFHQIFLDRQKKQ